jgi:hypothetical protein
MVFSKAKFFLLSYVTEIVSMLIILIFIINFVAWFLFRFIKVYNVAPTVCILLISELFLVPVETPPCFLLLTETVFWYLRLGC